MTVNVWPAMVRVPLRGAPVAFASTVNCTVPDPAPFEPAVIVIHGTLLTAVHAHESDAVTATEPDPPPTATGCPAGAMENVQPPS